MRLSLHGLGSTQFVPPRDGVDPATAASACQIAGGTWKRDPRQQFTVGVPAWMGCELDIGPSLPSWCSWVPFAGSISNDCKIPDAKDLANYGSYTAYMTGQLPGPESGLEKEQQMVTENQTQSEDLVAGQDCAYRAAINHQTLASMIGPDLACALSEPFNGYGWLLYLGAGVALYLTLSRN